MKEFLPCRDLNLGFQETKANVLPMTNAEGKEQPLSNLKKVSYGKTAEADIKLHYLTLHLLFPVKKLPNFARYFIVFPSTLL